MKERKMLNLPAVIIMALCILMLEGCADVATPVNIEPEIRLLEVTEITRTDATLGVGLMNREGLSYLRFKYGPTAKMETESDLIRPDSDTIRFHLSGLTPSTTYHFMAEGGNGHAVISTPVMTFNTLPYVVPTLSEPVSLSSGPAGILVGFDILSDGGTPVLTAGCYVVNLSTGEKSKVNASPNALSSKQQRIYASTPRRDCDYEIIPFASNIIGETSGTSLTFTPRQSITLDIPGVLSLMAESVDFYSGMIEISGLMNGDDFRFLRILLGAPSTTGESSPSQTISRVNIADVEITEGGGPYDGSRFTEASTVTTDLFAECGSLKSISLPVSATRLMGDAFRNCESLESITLSPSLNIFSPSAGCKALKEITIAAGNENFKSAEGVLFNSNMSEILWFPAGKDGSYEIPQSVARIGENTFRDSRLSTLIFPDGLTAIGRSALAGSNIKEVVLPDRLENVPEALFQNDSQLQSVTLGSNTSYIGAYVFDGCPLRTLYIPSSYPPVLANDAFGTSPEEIFSSCVLHVKEGTAGIYRNHYTWRKFSNIIADL